LLDYATDVTAIDVQKDAKAKHTGLGKGTAAAAAAAVC